jgi:hypothetical protein
MNKDNFMMDDMMIHSIMRSSITLVNDNHIHSYLKDEIEARNKDEMGTMMMICNDYINDYIIRDRIKTSIALRYADSAYMLGTSHVDDTTVYNMAKADMHISRCGERFCEIEVSIDFKDITDWNNISEIIIVSKDMHVISSHIASVYPCNAIKYGFTIVLGDLSEYGKLDD